MKANAFAASASRLNPTGRGSAWAAGLLALLCGAALAFSLTVAAGSARGEAWIDAGSFPANLGGGIPSSPTGLAVDQSDDLVYVSNLTTTTFSLTEILKLGLDGSPGEPASFGSGKFDGVAVDQATGTVYGLSDATLFFPGDPASILSYTPAGAEAESPIPVTTLHNSAGGRTVQIASDSEGNVYFPSLAADEVQVFEADGTALPALNGSGEDALEDPHSVATDDADNVYVADTAVTVNEQQEVSVDATGGTFELSFEGDSTGAEGSGDVTEGSPTITSLSVTEGTFVAGEAISGPGIPAGATISSVDTEAEEIEISANATETVSAAALTADLKHNSSSSVIRAALAALPGIDGSANVSVGDIGPWTVTFQGEFAGTDVAEMSADGSGLTGGTETATVTTIAEGSFSPGRVLKFDSAGSFDSVVVSENDPQAPQPTGLGVDPESGTIFVAKGKGSSTFVTAYDATGEPLADFGSGEFSSGFAYTYSQIAVDSETGRVYVSDPGAAEVEMYDALPAPSVTTEAATEVSQTGAKLHATVNAEGLEADCSFEYDTDPGFESPQAIACIPDPVIGSTDTPVSATIEAGLEANTTYHFRVVAENEGGLSEGEALQFTTPADPPAATTGSAGDVGEDSATLNATVDANGADADCEFQYGTSTGYGNSVPCSPDPVTGDGATAVSADIGGLSDGTTYHYRVVATNSGGTSNGSDATFSTDEAPEPPSDDGDDDNGSSAPPPPPPAPPQVCPVNRALCPPGRLFAVGVAEVRRGRALVKVRCRGAAFSRCAGAIRLTARVKAGKRKRNIALGAARYNLPAKSALRVVRVRLNGAGKRLLRRSGRRGLRAVLVGPAVKNRAVKLRAKPANNKRRQGRRGNRR